MHNKKKALLLVLIIVVLSTVCFGVAALASGVTKDGGNKSTYTVYAIGGYLDKFYLVLSPSVLEEEEANSCWFHQTSTDDEIKAYKQEGLIYGADEIRAYIQQHQIAKDQIRVVLLHNAIDSFVWENNAYEKNMDIEAYKEMVTENVISELGV